MRKKMLILLMLGLSTLGIADHHGKKMDGKAGATKTMMSGEMVEDAIEEMSKYNKLGHMKGYLVDYDVDVHEIHMKYEIEYEGMKEPNIDAKKIENEVITMVKKNAPQIKTIYLTIEYDPILKKDKTLYASTITIK